MAADLIVQDYGIALAYVCLFCLTISQIQTYKSSGRSTSHSLFLAFMMLQTLFRSIDFFVSPWYYGAYKKSVPEVWKHLLENLPAAFFFSTFTLLVWFWATVHYFCVTDPLLEEERLASAPASSYGTAGGEAGPAPVGRRRVLIPLRVVMAIFVLLNVVFYASVLMEIALDVSVWAGDDAVQEAAMVVTSRLAAVLCLVMAVFFLGYGFGLVQMFRERSYSIESEKMQSQMKRIFGLTLVTGACFTIRAIILTTGLLVITNSADRTWITSVYYLTCELVPASAMLFVFRSQSWSWNIFFM
eukprot:tig00020614_g12204.t1